MCRNCEVQGACLAWALDAGDCHGVWGATTPRERRAMLIAWRADEEAAPPMPIRRLETMSRRDGVETIMSLDRLSVTDLTADLSMTEMATVDAIAAAEGITIGHLRSVETIGAAAS